MSSRVFAPVSIAVAALLAAAPLIAPANATPAAGKAAATSAAPAAVHKLSLKTGLAGGKMVYLDDKGNVNPTLRARVGDTIEVTIASGEGAQHDIVFEGIPGARSKMFGASTGATKIAFKLTKAGQYTYLCSVPGHRQIGMEGMLEVTGPANAAAVLPAEAVQTTARRPCLRR